MTTDGRFDGRVVLVTGASRGIGRALASGFAGQGASVVAAARTIEPLHELVEELARDGHRAHAVRFDVAALESHQALIDETIGRYGRLDVLVNNAGVLKPHFTTRVTPAELDHMYDVNLKGPLFLSIAALESLSADGGGTIVNIGALCASQPMEGLGAYCAIKAAMANWSTTMAREWAERGVRVNTLVPGSVATDMILPSDPARRAAFMEEMAGQNVFGRLATPEDLVGAALFLAGEASAFMTGRSVYVDGGLLR